MKRRGLDLASALASGILFGVGLAVSGMSRPEKVLGFLDVGGAWDASLAFVMAGAIAVHFLAYRLIRRRQAPLCADKFGIPTRRDIDAKLLAGAALFGVGWGLGGYCPGPSLVSLGAGSQDALVFVATMLVGTFVTARLEASAAKNTTRSADQEPGAKAG